MKSAYKVYIDNENYRYGSSNGGTVGNSSTGNSFPWHKIWDMPCPNKMKTFAWRLAHNSLPLKRKIESRGIDLDTKCTMCSRMDEDAGHLLFKCMYAKGVWRVTLMETNKIHMAGLQSPHFS